MSDHWTFAPAALSGFLSLVDRREIGCGIVIGTDADVVDVIRCPNAGAAKFSDKGKSLQTSWAIAADDEERASRIAEAIGCRVLGFVHTHRHGKTLPSLTDWRRQRYAHAFGAVFHPGSGLVTLSRRGVVGKPGGITYRARLDMPAGLSDKLGTFCRAPIDLASPRAAAAPAPISIPVADQVIPPRLVRELLKEVA